MWMPCLIAHMNDLSNFWAVLHSFGSYGKNKKRYEFHKK